MLMFGSPSTRTGDSSSGSSMYGISARSGWASGTRTIPAPTLSTSTPCASSRSFAVREVHWTSSPGALPTRAAYCSAVRR